ncbi:TolC family protein [Aquimarina gracilis]|uniref:TolC family protein n=1 Tax=Aquimarina gracilis TaxID=874422 RepID=A0ABU5ZVC9_9FLAO|nr:TolC family protein [Aquimarina gracilis]MEB3345647.1 TolC family protein [Aquimarina gracilis]
MQPYTKHKHVMLLCVLFLYSLIYGQEIKNLTLIEVIEMSQDKSITKQQSTTKKETKYWEYKNYLSNYKPQLILNGTIPSFTRSFNEVVQPDGNITFEPVNFNNSSLSLNLEQSIAATGSTLYVSSELQRFDDLENNSRLYNSSLLSIGLEQPLFQFNKLKWDKKIEPLKYEESQKEYLESIELISLTATELFFDVLLSQERLKITKSSLSNTQDILNIANTKFQLGEVSKNEILQLELELLKSKKNLIKANKDLELSKFRLRSFTGLNDKEVDFDLILPNPSFLNVLSEEKMLEQAMENRSDIISFKRRLLEAKQKISEAKSANGLSFDLSARIGFSNRSDRFETLADDLQENQYVALTFNLPILDWGRSKSRIATARANERLEEDTIKQEEQNFQQEIFTEITLFNLLMEQIEITKEADKIASQKYEIAKNTYKLGNLSVTDLSIAFSERDEARQDFIEIFRSYWTSYYTIRMLTLYDFEKQEKIY